MQNIKISPEKQNKTSRHAFHFIVYPPKNIRNVCTNNKILLPHQSGGSMLEKKATFRHRTETYSTDKN